MKTEIKTLSDREHILIRPSMYIGGVDLVKNNEYILEDNTISQKEIEYVPALIKIINEVIDNSVDVAIKTNFKYSNLINIKIDENKVSVQDNGTGIPISKNSDGLYTPLMCWGYARSGANFSDDENRTQIGMNGIGSYATNCFSKEFVGETDDGEHSYKIVFKNNASEYTETVKPSSKQGTKVTFAPDLARFGLSQIDANHIKVIEQRLLNLSMVFPEITFKLNGKNVSVGTFKKFVNLFGDESVILETENYKYAILYNPDDDFRQYSYVNGLKIPDGGTHIDAVIEPVVAGIREKLQKKFKTIKPADIKNKLLIIGFLKNLPNSKFNSQAKEKITNSRKEISDYLGDIDFEDLIKKVLRTSSIIDGITEIFKIKEEFKKRQDLKSLTRVKKIKSDKYVPSVSKNKILLLCEGESSFGSCLPSFGRDGFGYYMLKGKPLNVITNTHQKFISNKELTELLQIVQTEGYEYVVTATDADLDGLHIQGLLSAFIWKMCPEFKGKFGVLSTPIIMVSKNSKPVKWYYNLDDDVQVSKGETSMYLKGLGSWDSEDLKHIVKTDGIENMISILDFDNDTILLEWLGNNSAPRKEYIMNNEFNIARI